MPILLKKGCPVSSVYHIKKKKKKGGTTLELERSQQQHICFVFFY